LVLLDLLVHPVLLVDMVAKQPILHLHPKISLLLISLVQPHNDQEVSLLVLVHRLVMALLAMVLLDQTRDQAMAQVDKKA
jgi:hypothetical protein